MTVVDFKARYIAHNFILTKQGQSCACLHGNSFILIILF